MRSWRADLLLMLTVVLGPAVGHFTQQSYHAEEHRNITLTCLFPVGTDMPPDSLQVDLMKVETSRGIYWYDSRLEAEPYTDEFYRGRLHCDSQLTREEQIQCVLTDLRLNDSGLYRCVVVATRKRNEMMYHITVTASRNQTVEETSEPATRERIWFYVNLGLFLVAVAALAVCHVIAHRNQIRFTDDTFSKNSIAV